MASRDGSSSTDWVGTAGMVLGPIILLASTIAYITNGDGMNEGETGGVLQVWAFIGLSVAVALLTRRFADVAPTASSLLLVAGLAGTASGVGYGIDSVQAAVFGTETLQETSSAAAPLALQLPGLLLPLALLGIGLMLARTKTAPSWAAITLVVGAVLFPLGRIPGIEAIALVSDAVLLLALGGIAFGAARARVAAPSPA